jgi:hypothetical protein
MFYIGCTRFNNDTYKENIDYRFKNQETVIYGSALKIREIYLPDSLIFVAEMNNDTNKIEGIGLIRNSLVYNKKHKIYEHIEYNRYIYNGKYWLKREILDNMDPDITKILDTVLFKGKSHLKCRSGISIITDKLFSHWDYKLGILKEKIKNVFLRHFINTEELTEASFEIEETIEIVPKTKRNRRRLDKCDKNIEN